MHHEIQLIRDLGKIKRVKRAGWVREGIPDPESVADHSYRVAIMAMIFGDKLGVDTNQLIKLALLHDLAEGMIGDLVVERAKDTDEQARNQKESLEIKTLNKIFQGIVIEKDITNLFEDAVTTHTLEAKILKQLERLEMAVQALEYEEEYGKDLSEFFVNAVVHITHPFLKRILDEVISQRKNTK